MRVSWQATGSLIAAATCHAEENSAKFVWLPVAVSPGMFTQDLGMLDSERDEFASNLAAHAASHLVKEKASVASLKLARRLLGLALQISPRNKRAVVICFQLGKGILPDTTAGDYGPQALSRVLLSRGQLLGKQGGAQDQRLSRYFIQLAADIDPKNEDAVYASEMQRLDLGEIDWMPVTDGGDKPPLKGTDGD